LRLNVAPFMPLMPAVKRAIAAEAKDIADFLGEPVEVGS
jgi:hypothetical protein